MMKQYTVTYKYTFYTASTDQDFCSYKKILNSELNVMCEHKSMFLSSEI